MFEILGPATHIPCDTEGVKVTDPEVQGRIDRLTRITVNVSERELRELRVEIDTLKYALRHVYTRVEAARGAFSDEVLELIGYRKEEE